VRRAALLFNPRAGAHRAKKVDAIRAALAADYTLEVTPTSGPEQARELARAALAARLDALFVLGGDGTLRVVASVLAGSGVAVGALPGGTTNVVAMSLGRCGGEPFLMQVSGGLDATILAGVDARLKRRLGKGAIAVAGLAGWWRYRFPEIELEIDGEAATVTGFVVSNLAAYAGRFEIVPGARADDRQLEILLFRGRSRRDALGFAFDLARGTHTRRGDVEVRPLARLRVLSSAGRPLQYDGDPFAPALPLEIGLAEERLLLLAPG
jgi:diacylglycerol kinase (ATP)